MLLATVADVKATFIVWTHNVDLADVIATFVWLMFFAIVVDVFTTVV